MKLGITDVKLTRKEKKILTKAADLLLNLSCLSPDETTYMDSFKAQAYIYSTLEDVKRNEKE